MPYGTIAYIIERHAEHKRHQEWLAYWHSMAKEEQFVEWKENSGLINPTYDDFIEDTFDLENK